MPDTIQPIFPWTGHLPELAREAAQRVGHALDADAVWLFGSAARNEIGPDSDIDLLVVVPGSDEPRYRRAQRAQRLLADLRVPKDVIVVTREEWERQLKVATSLPSTVVREGLLLYGRSEIGDRRSKIEDRRIRIWE